MFGIDRNYLPSAVAQSVIHQLSPGHHRFFIGKRDSFPGFRRRQRRTEPSKSNHGIEDNIRFTRRCIFHRQRSGGDLSVQLPFVSDQIRRRQRHPDHRLGDPPADIREGQARAYWRKP